LRQKIDRSGQEDLERLGDLLSRKEKKIQNLNTLDELIQQKQAEYEYLSQNNKLGETKLRSIENAKKRQEMEV
jgi:hypothetical protein